MRKALIALTAGTVIAVAPMVSEVEAKKGGGGGRGGGGGASSSSGGGGGGSGGSGKGGSARSSSIGSGGGGYSSSRVGNISGSVRGSVGNARTAWNGPRGELAVSRRARRNTSSLRGAEFGSPWYGADKSCYAWDQAGWQWLRVC